MSTDEKALRRRSEDLHARYRYGFAGKPRLTRNVADLEVIIQNAKALLDEAVSMVGDGEVASEMRERLSLYMEERDRIVEQQKAGPDAIAVSVLATRANALFGLYRRHFAGQNRLTRDLRLLDDLSVAVTEVRDALRARLSSPAADVAQTQIDVVQQNIDLYASERETIVSARAEASPQDMTSVYANVANAQFAAYRDHFAGKSRRARRVALIDRIVANLEECESGMSGLIAEGHEKDTNTKNLGIVRDRLGQYRNEAAAIREARANSSVFEIIDALGQDANGIMEDYVTHFAGKDRATRNLDTLGGLLDRLVEVERQMWGLARVQDNDANTRNLRIVQDTILVYESEYQKIREAQSH